MFRVALLLTLLGVAHGIVWGHGHGHGWGGGHHHGHGGGCGHDGSGSQENIQNLTWHSEYDRRFERLSAYMIRADRYAKDFCDRFTPTNVQESHGNSAYTLIYTMPQLDPNNIAVKIQHRVLYMYARQSDSNDSPTYVDVKILPDILKLSDASWTYANDQLIINIPYEPALTVKIVKTCVDVNTDIKDVPKRSPIIYKFEPGNANF